MGFLNDYFQMQERKLQRKWIWGLMETGQVERPRMLSEWVGVLSECCQMRAMVQGKECECSLMESGQMKAPQEWVGIIGSLQDHYKN